MEGWGEFREREQAGRLLHIWRGQWVPTGTSARPGESALMIYDGGLMMEGWGEFRRDAYFTLEGTVGADGDVGAPRRERIDDL